MKKGSRGCGLPSPPQGRHFTVSPATLLSITMPLLILLLGPVLRPGLFAVGNLGGVPVATDDVVLDAGEITHPPTPHKDDGVFLKVMALARNISGDFGAAGEAHTSDLPLGRVGLLRRADARHGNYALQLRTALEGTHLILPLLRDTGLADKLIDRRHYFFFLRFFFGGRWFSFLRLSLGRTRPLCAHC